MGEVLKYTGQTVVDLPAEIILDGAKSADLDTVLVIGWDKNGESYTASSTADTAELLLMLETAKRIIMDNVFDG